MMNRSVDLVIIGGGAAGVGAAISAYDHGVKDIVLLERKPSLGGILNQCIHAGFGLSEYKEELTGPEFLTRLVREVKKRDITIKCGCFVTSLSPNHEVTYLNRKDGLVTLKAKAIILATGSLERSPGAICLNGERVEGIITAGSAQQALNEAGQLVGKNIVILGSGDIGLIMARRFSLEGAHVIKVLEIMPYSNGLLRNKIQCLDDFGIPLELMTTVKEVRGKKRVEEVITIKVDEKQQWIPGTEEVIKCDTLVLSVGLIPSIALLNKMPNKPIEGPLNKVDENMQSLLPGYFIAGNCLHIHDLADMALEEGKIAGEAAASYIAENGLNCDGEIPVNVDSHFGSLFPSRISQSMVRDSVKASFRVKSPISSCTLFIKQGENVLLKRKYMRLNPSEMEFINIPKKLLINYHEPLDFSLEVDPK